MNVDSSRERICKNMELTIEDKVSDFCMDICACSVDWFLTLLYETEKGQWVDIYKAYQDEGESFPDDIDGKDNLFAVWLDDPTEDAGYIKIIFHHVDLCWTGTASYNLQFIKSEKAKKYLASLQ